MKEFMDRDFLLENETAQTLFHEFAEKTPILDYHCHINPQEIAEDRKFENITQVWLGGDHYKWRLMRSFGVEEKYITGDASDYEKFCKWAKCLGKAIGNPLFQWSHLELQRYFGYYGYLNERTADEVWNLCNAKLQEDSMSVRNIIRQSGVTLICTTDDPIDSLEWHQKLAKDSTFEVKVLPAWRPDKAVNIEKKDFNQYIAKLSAAAEMKIASFADLKAAISKRMDFFAANGCSVSDHGLDFVMYHPAPDTEIEMIFAKKLAGGSLSQEEILRYKTACLLFLGKQYAHRDWAMQLHYGCKRDNNRRMFEKLGPDTGYDCIGSYTPAAQLVDFLDTLCASDELPRTIIYSLNPADNEAIGSIIGCFQDSAAVGKIQHGSAWWFNDHKVGMEQQITSLANLGNLSGFVGMLTDSRSFLSYARHEYFRRVLCNLIGRWVENGEFPADMGVLREIVEDICYNNAKRYFKFPL